MNPSAIENHLKIVLIQWGLIIAVARIFGSLGRRLGQPLAVGEIFAGLLLGPSFLGALFPELLPTLFPPATQQSLQLLGKLGLVLLLFQVGMEFDFSHLRSRSRTVSAVSVLGIIGPFMGGMLISSWLHTNFAPSTPFFGFTLFVCVALSITALPILGRILLENNLERTPLGVMSISAAAIDDAAGWVLLGVITALVTSGFHWQPLLLQLLGLTIYFVALMYGVSPLLRRAYRYFREKSESDLPPSALAMLLIALFASCWVTNSLGVFAIFGAFLLGVSLHQELPLVSAWRSRFADFVLVAFVPVFFTNTGLRTDIGSLATFTQWIGCLAVLAVATIGKFGGCWLGARLTGQSSHDALCIGALMNTRALMALIAINVGADLGLLPKELFSMFVIMALVTTAMTGPCLKRWLPAQEIKVSASDPRVS